jgi:hypothetical protein
VIFSINNKRKENLTVLFSLKIKFDYLQLPTKPLMQIKILKNRSDIGAGTRGSDLGIDAMEIAAIGKENHYFNEFPFRGYSYT